MTVHAGSVAEDSTPDAQTEALVRERLGRTPRGLRAVAVADDAGRPMVIRVASLVEGKPFPTLFWLIDPALKLRIDREEAAGRIAEFQARVDASATLRAAMCDDHRAHIALRHGHLEAEERALMARQGFLAALEQRGIGGIEDFTRIRCLHTWYAAHLVVPNAIGALLDAHWRAAESDRR